MQVSTILYSIPLITLILALLIAAPVFWMAKRRLKPVIPVTTSSRDGEHLTEHELHLISKYSACPDCQVGQLLEGPSGGCSTNYLCDNCGSEFNLAVLPGWQAVGERISPKGPRDPGNRWNLYGPETLACTTSSSGHRRPT